MAIAAFEVSERYPGEPAGSAPARPSLRVVESDGHGGGPLADITPIGSRRPAIRHGVEVTDRRAARQRVLVRRRRIAVAVLALGLLTGLALPVSILGGTAPDPAATSLAGASDAGSAVVYVVQPGDTLASIAAGVDPGDPAAMAQRLARQIGSSTVVPGEHITLP
jgi:hypothetical protein